LLVYVALGAASIVEPHGFSGSLPVMIFLCVVNSVSLFSRIKMFCSVLFRLLSQTGSQVALPFLHSCDQETMQNTPTYGMWAPQSNITANNNNPRLMASFPGHFGF